MTSKFTETAKTQVLIKPQADIDTAAVTGASYKSVAGYRRAAVLAAAEGPGAGKKLTVQLKQATAANGTGAKDLGAAVEVTAVATEDLVAVAETWVEQMDVAGGFTFISASIKTDKGSAVDGSALLVLDHGRYSE